MLLITVARLPSGYRIVAASTHRECYACWSLYRNGALLAVISRNSHGENSINFDLKAPLAPGRYTLRVESFAWSTGETADALGYQTDIVALPTLDTPIAS
ncbi:MAG: hypothetical protein KDE53_14810 [Caldilineaceae bacterium]|nr:hypothetical protein [Caldilineaceae bacterium]MCB0121934.1 hypothetical protein [Caldilineaceae bacterium]MCB0185023.1 hypothetical protein [Caldilineaceae bacterium]